MTYADKSIFVGSWRNNLRHGHGKCIFADGSEYEGEFQRGFFEGYGVLTYSEARGGGFYAGDWTKGEKKFGMEVRADGTLRHDGQWKNGTPVRSFNHTNSSVL